MRIELVKHIRMKLVWENLVQNLLRGTSTKFERVLRCPGPSCIYFECASWGRHCARKCREKSFGFNHINSASQGLQEDPIFTRIDREASVEEDRKAGLLKWRQEAGITFVSWGNNDPP